MWTKEERNLAKELTQPEMIKFLEKMFVQTVPSIDDLEKNIAALDDAEYGRLMKVKFLSGEENKARINLLRKLAQETKEGKQNAPVAPR